MRYFVLIAFLTHASLHLQAQNENDKFSKQLIPTILELSEFVGLPSDAHFPDDILKNIDWLHQAFENRGFETQELTTSSSPLFFAEMIISEELPTVLFYMHLDGQPVDPEKWNQPGPYQVVLKELNNNGIWEALSWQSLDGPIDREWRLFGRAVADDKGPIIAFLNTIDILHADKAEIKCNIKVILDSEEEIGSPNLAPAVKNSKDILAADVLIIADGPTHVSGEPTLVFGCRGITTLNLTTYGPVVPQHSGHYGNYAPNPAFAMARLLTSMKDEDGIVLIEGYYDGIELSSDVKASLAAVPDNEKSIHDLLQIAWNEKVGNNYQESLQYPSLNVRGLSSGWVGAQARTIVPDIAEAAIDIRLVPESDPERLFSLIKEHITEQGYHIVDHDPTKQERLTFKNIVKIETRKATLPFRTEMDSEAGVWLRNALSSQFDSETVNIRIMGGTVPIAPFVRELDIPAIIVPVVNADNNQHSPNENLRIGNLITAMQSFHAILTTSM